MSPGSRQGAGPPSATPAPSAAPGPTAAPVSSTAHGPARWWPTQAAIAWLVAGVATVLLGLVTRRPDVAALGVPLLVGLAWSSAHRPRGVPTARLTGEDQPPGTGGLVAAGVEITPATSPSAVAVRVRAPGHRPAYALVAADRRTVSVSMRTVRTGRRELFALAHRGVGPDGLHSGPAFGDPPLMMTILPSTRPLSELPLPFRLQGLTGPHRSRRAGSGGELRDVAPFTPGDRLRRIDWRVTARLNTAPTPTGGAGRSITQLYARRTFATADATVMLVIDSRDQVGPRVSSWGDAASLREDESTSLDIARYAAASLAQQYLAAGDRVGLEDLGRLRRPAPPAGGRRQLLLLTHHLALAEPEGEPTRRRRVPRLPSGALIVLFSTFLDDDAAAMAQTWRRAGHRVLAVDTLPPLLVSGIGERLHVAYRIVAMERADRLRRLAAAGVETMSWMDPGADPGLELTRMSRLRERR